MREAARRLARQYQLAWWLVLFAGYAAIEGIVTRGPSSTWGVWAAPGYALAALAAWRWRGSALPLLIGVCAAVVAPTIWLSTGFQPGEEPIVVARAASLLLHHGSPYLSSGQLLSTQSYNPYLPAMSIFGFPYMAGLAGVLGSPESWMAVATIVLAVASVSIGLPPSQRREPWILWRNTALAIVTPVLALPLALGTTDPPVIALMCVALACASRSAASGALADEPAGVSTSVSAGTGVAAGTGLAGTGSGPWDSARWVTWNGLAALTIGIVCAMKVTAWPVVPVVAAMIATRESLRAAIRFAVAAAVTAVILTIVFAPALLTQPGAFADNIILYPLGLAHQLTTAASPLPGHLLAGTGTLGRLAALGLLVAGAAAFAWSLVVRPPKDIRAATVYVALGLTLLFTLAPDARFGYFAYPAALLGWLALTNRSRAEPETPPAAVPEKSQTVLPRPSKMFVVTDIMVSLNADIRSISCERAPQSSPHHRRHQP